MSIPTRRRRGAGWTWIWKRARPTPAPNPSAGSVRGKRPRRLLHSCGRLITDAGKHGEEVPVSHRRAKEGPSQSAVLYIDKLPSLIVRQLAADGPLERFEVERRLLGEPRIEE